MTGHKALAAVVAAAIVVTAAGAGWWLDRPRPPVRDEETEYWRGIAMVEQIDAEFRAAEKRCGGPVDVLADGRMRCRARNPSPSPRPR